MNPREPRHPRHFRHPRVDDRLSFSGILMSLRQGESEKLTFGEVVDAFGDRAFGAVMLVVGLINLLPWPPGGTTITGAPLLFITLQLAFSSEHLWLPRFITRASISRRAFDHGLDRFGGWIRRAERLTRPRWRWIIGPLGQALIGVVGFVLAVILVLPIPFGNFLPAVAICLFAVGLMQRDGVVTLMGWVAAGGSFFLLSLVWRGVLALAERVWEQIRHWPLWSQLWDQVHRAEVWERLTHTFTYMV